MNTAGMANSSESILSNIPPCPGMKWPESLISIVRFTIDSNRSPNVPNTTTNNDMIAILRMLSGAKNHAMAIPPNMAIIPPPIAPSHVFLGDSLSNSLCLPIVIPHKYANVSFNHTIANGRNTVNGFQPPSQQVLMLGKYSNIVNGVAM